MALYLFFLLFSVYGYLHGYPQSNYADQANNVEYIGKGLPEQATLDGKVTQLDDLSPIITLNRTKAALNCAAGSMQVELKFNDKFYGIAYADFDRNSACQVSGKGAYSYELELPLKGCGTKQSPQRVFTNNIVVRFHPGLEMDGDEIITIVCRYPPPVAPLPSPVTNRIFVPPAAPLEPPLNGFHILLIICGILFLSLLLLGLGCSYYCLRRRTIPVLPPAPFSTIGTESEITKLSGSSLGNLSLIEGVKIPRAHALVAAPGSSSGSEGPLISDTIPSDYPSESHSEVEDVDTRSLPVSSAGSFENRAYVHDTSSFYSEHYGHTQEQSIKNAVAIPATQQRLPMPIKEEPKFDVQVRVKKVPPPSPPSLSESDTQSSRNLSTIIEQREESVRSIDSPPVDRTHFTYVPELHPPPKHIQPAPTFNRILRRQQEIAEDIETTKSPSRAVVNLDTELTGSHSVTEVFDENVHRFVAPTPPPPPPIIPKQQYLREEASPPQEFPITPVHKPEITSHVVDDVYLKTITEKKRIEDIERHKRYVTEYHTRPKPVEDQKWDVTIKNYPIDMPEPPDWENFSDISSASNMTLTPKMERAPLSLPPQPQIDDNKLPLTAPEIVSNIASSPPRRYYSSTREEISNRESYLETFNIPAENPEVSNWNVLIRVLQPHDDEGPVLETAEEFNSQLTMSDKMKWRQIITTESTLRTLLTEATVKEDFERIRSDRRYETLFEPPKWDVIIRILTPDKKGKGHYRKKSDWDNRSRRSSLPTLYEYDSDGGSSVKTLTNEPAVRPQIPLRLRKSSRSSYRSEADLRSMSEMTVDFARPDHIDTQSEASSYYPGPGRYYDDSETETDYKPGFSQHPSLTRSLSQPSLARSASEFTERWVAPSRYDTASEYTTPEGTPRSQRSTRIQPIHVPRSGAEQSSVWEQTSSSQVAQAPGGTRVVAQQYRSEMSSSYQQSGRRNWFGDNDSEASFK